MSLKTVSMKLVKSQKWNMLFFGKNSQLHFLSRQLLLQRFQLTGCRYCSQTAYNALNLFLRVRNCYRELGTILALPKVNTPRSYLGTLELLVVTYNVNMW